MNDPSPTLYVYVPGTTAWSPGPHTLNGWREAAAADVLAHPAARAEVARLTAEAHDRMESALYDALGEPSEAEREAAHDRILSRRGSAADVEISGAGPSWGGLLARVRALRAERDAYASFAHEIAALVVSDGGFDTLRHLGPSDLDHLGEVVRARLAGDAPVHRGPPHDWPLLIDGDCEGGGEPEIFCEACGEEGYHCYCGEGLCRYCGGDCGESGCHDVSDADEVSHG